MEEKSRILKKASEDQSRPVSFNDSFGGSENQLRFLLKYLPDIIQKIIDISEYYEGNKCNDELHKNTKLLKEIHSNLFLQNNMKIDLPSLGIGEFFKDFEENIYTKIILLIFIAYVVTQFIRLFTVNLNLSGCK